MDGGGDGESGYSSPSLECGGVKPVTNIREPETHD